VDECSRYGGPSLCQQICKNNIGSYRCLCYQGYQLLANGRTCVTSKYLGLTGLPGLCGEYGCDMSCNHGGCEEISRVCPVGFIMIETSNGVSCKDLDECTGNRSPCQQRCQNVIPHKVRRVTVIQVYTPTEADAEEQKDEFYNQLQDMLEEVPSYDIKLLINDINVKLNDNWQGLICAIKPYGSANVQDIVDVFYSWLSRPDLELWE
ncbi:hypothetical protein scyTo_0017927, partial [Scyliorhinus torazame]|nr:hypothetical protein [Scyliorhinus torazame]